MEAPPPVPPPSQEASSSPSMSLGARIMNVFATPGEVFAQVKAGPPSTANWLAPVLLSCLVGIIYSFVVFSQDTVLHQMREQREKAMEKKLEKMSKEERERVMEMTEKFTTPTLMKTFGAVGAT